MAVSMVMLFHVCFDSFLILYCRQHLLGSNVLIMFFSCTVLDQIIEKDVSSSDFCTRREFARWFVKLCSKFER